MTRAQIWLQHLSNLLVGGTGAVYFVMEHLLTSDDPFAVVNHPAQPLMQHLHVLSAPMLVFVVGCCWALHARPNAIRARWRPWRSGLVLMGAFAPLAASGYLLQVSVDPAWRSVWLWTHLATGVLWMLAYPVHAARSGTRSWRPPLARWGEAGPRQNSDETSRPGPEGCQRNILDPMETDQLS